MNFIGAFSVKRSIAQDMTLKDVKRQDQRRQGQNHIVNKHSTVTLPRYDVHNTYPKVMSRRLQEVAKKARMNFQMVWWTMDGLIDNSVNNTMLFRQHRVNAWWG